MNILTALGCQLREVSSPDTLSRQRLLLCQQRPLRHKSAKVSQAWELPRAKMAGGAWALQGR